MKRTHQHSRGGGGEREGEGLAPSLIKLSMSVKQKHMQKTEHLFCNGPWVTIFL